MDTRGSSCLARRLRAPALAALCLAAALPRNTLASPKPGAQAELVQHCLAQAAASHGVSLALLRAVAQQESGLQPQALRRNTDGSVDHGLMQVNSRWLPVLARHGISREALMQPCVNADVGAWILAQALRTEGDTWRAVGAYHSRTPQHNRQYAWAIYRRLAQQPPHAD